MTGKKPQKAVKKSNQAIVDSLAAQAEQIISELNNVREMTLGMEKPIKQAMEKKNCFGRRTGCNVKAAV